MRWIVGIAIAFAAVTAVSARVVTFQPPKPGWGRPFVIHYDPSVQGAKFHKGDPVHIVVRLYYPDRVETAWAPMGFEDGFFKHFMRPKEGVGYIRIDFVTPTAWDDGAHLETRVHQPNGTPARGAYQHGMHHGNARESLERELEHHPDNYAVYRDYWLAHTGSNDLVRRGVEMLETVESSRPVDLLYTLISGHMMLSREPRARAYLLEIFERFPGTHFAQLALSYYEYQVFARQLKGEGPDLIKRHVLELVSRHPSSPIARERLWALAYDKTVPLEVVNRIHREWVLDRPDHPMPYFGMALALSRRETDPDRGSALARIAAELIREGKLRFYEDVRGSLTKTMLREAHRTAARQDPDNMEELLLKLYIAGHGSGEGFAEWLGELR